MTDSPPHNKPNLLRLQDKVSKVQKDNRIRIQVRKTRQPLVREVCLNHLGWRIWGRKDPKDAVNLYWLDDYIDEEFLRKLKPYQKVNHFPGSQNLGHKHLLNENLTRMRKQFPQQYAFFPATFNLPNDIDQYKKYAALNPDSYFIVKPWDNCQGRGIFLMRSTDPLPPSQILIQQYEAKPLLVENNKFDLRIYVLIRSLSPLKLYIYEEGLCRLATVGYEQPSVQNSNNNCMHLTNYAINLNSPNYVFNKSEAEDHLGHKRSYSAIMHTLHALGVNTAKLQQQIDAIIVKTVIACSPAMLKKCREAREQKESESMCFQLVGFDVLITHNHRPLLLEVNHHPSLSTDTPLDLVIKRSLLIDTLSIVSPQHVDKLGYFKSRWEQESQATHSAQATRLNKPKEQQQNTGAYRKIYPLSDSMGNQELSKQYSVLIKHSTAQKQKIKYRGSMETSIASKLYSQAKTQKVVHNHQQLRFVNYSKEQGKIINCVKEQGRQKDCSMSLYNVIKNTVQSKSNLCDPQTALERPHNRLQSVGHIPQLQNQLNSNHQGKQTYNNNGQYIANSIAQGINQNGLQTVHQAEWQNFHHVGWQNANVQGQDTINQTNQFILKEERLAYERRLRKEKARESEKRKEFIPMTNISIHYEHPQHHELDSPFKIHSFLNTGAFQHSRHKDHSHKQHHEQHDHPHRQTGKELEEAISRNSNAFSLQLKRRIQRIHLTKLYHMGQRKNEGCKFIIKTRPAQPTAQEVLIVQAKH